MTPFELGMLTKQAYGGSGDDYEYDRWMDGGFGFDDKPHAESKQRVADITRTFADAAKARGANLRFYGQRYADDADMFSADEAIKRILAADKIDETNENSMPMYYHMDYPRKGLFEYMTHDEAFPKGTHPLSVVYDKYFKKQDNAKAASDMTAYELGMLTVKEAGKRGLWDNIHAKRERGESPAKPGDADYPDQKSWNKTVKEGGDAWQKAEGKNPEGGLNAKGRASLKAEGQDIKPPVTESNPKGERADRKSSFCARMGGMKKKLTSSETANDPDSRINKALRKWNC